MKRSASRGLVAAALAGGVLVGAGAALAASNVVTDTDNVHLRIVKSRVEDGVNVGWHTHPGPVFVQVQAGFLKIYQGTCEPKVVGPGDTLVEVAGVPVRAEAKGTVEWTSTLIYETGQAPSTPATGTCP